MQFLSTVFIGFIAAVRYLSLPPGYAILEKWWVALSSTHWGRKIFFVWKPISSSK